MREITQPMRLFDFVFGPLVLPLQDLDAREGELFLTTAQWQQQCRHAGFSKVAWLTAGWQPDRRDERTYHSRHAARSGG